MIIFTLLVALQSCFGTSSGTGTIGPAGVYETTSSRSIGCPSLVVIRSKTTTNGVTRTGVEVRWVSLLIVAGVIYCLAMAAGHLIMGKRRHRHPAKVLLAVIGGVLVLALLAAVVVSKQLWGYYLYRPTLDWRIVKATKVRSVTIVNTAPDGDGERIFVPDNSYSIAQSIEYAQTNNYYSLGERALIALKDANRLPPSPPPMSAERLARLYDVVAGTGRLETGEPGYDHAKDLRGVVIEADGADGAPLLFVGVQGGEVSNDHHPYYEFLFSGPGLARGMKLLSAQRFYFDVAGIEGMEWPAFFLGFSAAGLILSVPATLLMMALRGIRLRTLLIIVGIAGLILGNYVLVTRQMNRLHSYGSPPPQWHVALLALAGVAIDLLLFGLAYGAIRVGWRTLARITRHEDRKH